jgi:hypothetical protein
VTPIATTSSGGLHLYFAASKPYKNAVAINGSAIDIRTAGGYVLVPLYRNGRHWERSLYLTPMLPAPAWIDCALQRAPHLRLVSPRSDAPCVLGPLPAFELTRGEERKHRATALAALELAAGRVVMAKRGTRANILNKECFFLGGFIANGTLDGETAYHRLLEAAQAMVGADEFRDLAKRIRKSLEAGTNCPFPAPELGQ